MGTKFIRIEGEALVAVEEIIHRRTTLPEWLAAMNKLSPTPMVSPALPTGAVLYAQKGTQQLVVINQPAAVKKVIWRTSVLRDPEQRARTRWQLAIPPHVFLLVFNHDAIHSSHIYYAPGPIVSETDQLYYTNLANVYFAAPGSAGMPNTICAGNLRLNVKDPFAKRCQMFIDNFWESEFNDDIQPVMRRSAANGNQSVFNTPGPPKELLNLNVWEASTSDSPDFLTKMDWPFAPICSLATILNERWVVA